MAIGRLTDLGHWERESSEFRIPPGLQLVKKNWRFGSRKKKQAKKLLLIS